MRGKNKRRFVTKVWSQNEQRLAWPNILEMFFGESRVHTKTPAAVRRVSTFQSRTQDNEKDKTVNGVERTSFGNETRANNKQQQQQQQTWWLETMCCAYSFTWRKRDIAHITATFLPRSSLSSVTGPRSSLSFVIGRNVEFFVLPGVV